MQLLIGNFFMVVAKLRRTPNRPISSPHQVSEINKSLTPASKEMYPGLALD